ncbi:phage tail related [uncultured Mediterranean phage uvMED]|nr:phage tail related [uncultured Mediterranean phage uvMED]BAR22573.1 phage tail related [uncultured Mediterranean phage uvMED]
MSNTFEIIQKGARQKIKSIDGSRAIEQGADLLKSFGLQALKPKLYPNQELEIDENAEELKASYLGTPVFSNIAFKPGEYVDKDGNQISYGGGEAAEPFTIDTVLMDVMQQKQIIKTNIQGLSGSVKEYISLGDYSVSIRGALVDPNGARYPQEQVKTLVEFLEAPTSLAIGSRFLNSMFEIQNLVIDSYMFLQSEGVQNVQLFEIRAISDDPIELTING